MKHIARRLCRLCALGLPALLLSGCGPAPEPEITMLEAYHAALARTEPDRIAVPEPGSEIERRAIQRFIDFYREYSTEQIRDGVRDVYAADAFFADPFKAVEGIDAVETYFLKMAEPVQSCTFDVEGHTGSGGEYYFRWVMYLTVKNAPDRPIEALGASHVRFNADGKVVFQQDYWDAAALYEKLPFVGTLIRYVKRRIEN
ncbi:MAG: nuclear transport factor 2 family protein [Lentisphaerae bacterium]|nr:nuclear transport factor 2 family protein [Lentisphaerota bacterium]